MHYRFWGLLDSCLAAIDKRSAILAANIGASAPLIISSLVKTVPSGSQTRGGNVELGTILNFLAGR